MDPKSRKWLLLGLVGALIAFLLYRSRHLLNFADFSGDKLWAAIRNANVPLLLLSVVLIYLCYFLRSIRWRNFQKNVGPASLGSIYVMTLAGFSAVFLLGRAGEPIRPLLLSRKSKIPLADTFGIYALERIFDTASYAVLAAASLILISARRQSHLGETSAFETVAKTGATLLCLGVLFAIAVLVYLRLHGSAMLERRLQTWLAAHGWRVSVARILLGLVRGVQSIRTFGDLFFALLVSAAHWLLVAAIYYLIPLALGGQFLPLTFQDAIIVLVFTLVGSMVQLPGVGGGSQALTILAYTSVFGIEKEPAVAAAMMLWLITFASCSLAGIPLLIREGLSLGELRSMRAHEDEELDAEMSVKETT
jgi:glycosyltransferase 2 family protein